MATRLIEALAVPAMGAVAVMGAAFAANGAFEPAYGGPLAKFEMADVPAWAEEDFTRTDSDANGALDAREFGALAIVTAELAHLNGFVYVDAHTIALPIDSPAAISQSERARIAAVAAREFYLAAGDNDAVSRAEFVAHKLEKFRHADRNRNGILSTTELKVFAVGQTRINPGRA